MERIKQLLAEIYGHDRGDLAFQRIAPMLAKYGPARVRTGSRFSQEDAVLITYGDSLLKPGEKPLATLHRFAERFLKGVFSHVHLLPFFPYSSDDGFSVMDFFEINPDLGTWEDVASMGRDFRLVFDYVVNHFSSRSRWFRNYLADEAGFDAFAIEVDPAADLSHVTRPRALPLLTAYRKHDGRTVHLWTTFSEDQIDFNFKSLDVLEKMISVLLYYVERGAAVLRLDAVAYLWKETGTRCIHLPRTHAMVKLFRAVLDRAAPDVILLTETNVPHRENIRYFGDGGDEAQMVYNFTLPPLLFHSFAVGDATRLGQWARGLRLDADATTFFNFTASHDGIGVRPLEGILTPEELERLAGMVKAHGGRVSYKRNTDGSESPYELNITYVDAILAGSSQGGAAGAERFLASQAVQYALPGVPATYIHSLLGSRNWLEGVERTGRARTVNREKLQVEQVLAELDDPRSFRARIFFPYLALIKARGRQPAFHPNAGFDVLPVDPAVFGIRRTARDQTLYALTNVSPKPVRLSLSKHVPCNRAVDVITGGTVNTGSIELKPYQYMWLEAR